MIGCSLSGIEIKACHVVIASFNLKFSITQFQYLFIINSVSQYLNGDFGLN